MKPVALDLYCGLGGWTEGLQDEGWHVIGIDNEEHIYGKHRYPGALCIEDVRNLHGAWFKDVELIVASPPCQAYSYMAMPWKLAKAKAAAIRADTSGTELARLNTLFNECFRIQREACEAAGRHIPLVVENVRGAQEWVGPAKAHYGSFYLWGDVPPLPRATKVFKVPSDAGRRTDKVNGARFTSRDCGLEGVKHRGSGAVWFDTGPAAFSSSLHRKMESAMIAKIPRPLSRYIGMVFNLRTPSPLQTHGPVASEVASPGGRQYPSATSGNSGG